MRWTIVEGNFEIRRAQITYKGAETSFTDSQGRRQTGPSIGLVMNDQRFAGGEINANIEFSEISEANACELLFYFEPEHRWWALQAWEEGNTPTSFDTGTVS